MQKYDPKAINESKNIYLKGNKNIEYANDKYAAIENVDAMILITEWKEFRNPDFSYMGKIMKNKLIFDGRNQYNPNYINDFGFKYYQIGVKEQ